MSENRECGGDAAAYVLGALDPHEADAFRRHMEGCAVCHDEVAAFTQTVDALPLATPQVGPPRRLRKRVMRAVRAEPKRAARQRVRRSGRPLASFPRAGLATGLAVLAAAATVAAVALSPGGSPSRVIQARVIGVQGSAQLRLAGGQAELIVNHLPPPPAGRIYEVWLQHAKALSPTSALFSVTRTGAGDVGVPGDLHGVTEVLVTQEPNGGSRVPTHNPVIVARIT